MNGAELAAFVTITLTVVAGYVSSIYFIVSRIDTRLDRIEDRLTSIEVTFARIDQRLEDHIVNH